MVNGSHEIINKSKCGTPRCRPENPSHFEFNEVGPNMPIRARTGHSCAWDLNTKLAKATYGRPATRSNAISCRTWNRDLTSAKEQGGPGVHTLAKRDVSQSYRKRFAGKVRSSVFTYQPTHSHAVKEKTELVRRNTSLKDLAD